MPDISKINALAIGSVGKVDGLAKASILDIDGVAVPPAVAAPAAAYSVRLLGSAVGISSYTGDCMRVRRASDNVEADIAFDAGELKLTSGVSNTSDGQSYTDFADFVDHTGTPTDAFVRWWYDQSGNSNDAGQSTAARQPKIYDASLGLIEVGSAGNEKAAMDCANSALVASSVTLDSYYSWYYVAKPDASGGFIFEHSENSDPNNGGYNYLGINNTVEIYRNPSTATRNATAGAGYAGTSQTLIDWNYSGTWTAYKDGNSLAIEAGQGDAGDIGDSSATDELNLFSRNESSLFFNGKFQEIIFWNNDQDADGNRTDIESDINGFFSIY